ncbi:hypothetical protein GCM10011586_38130 [Silvibacterium dinghuense]|nr:hypothetical protein GCM10011586_38130 [Silvibacterium dinghuense]
MLLFVIFMVAILLIALAVAAPKMAKQLQRDKELELWHRGMQYKRAIKLYYKKFGAYPTSIDQLMNTNDIRYLRKRYKDPMTGKDDWKPVYFGQVHVQTLGLFGQPLTAAGAAGTAGVSAMAGSTAGLMATSSTDSSGSSDSSGSTNNTSTTSGSSFGSTSSTDSGSSFGSSSSSFGSTSSSPTGTTTGSTSGSMFASSSSSSDSGLSGGGPIVGVVIPDTRASIMEYKKQKHYNQWEFVYDPLEDQLLNGGAAASTSASGLSTTGTSTTSSGTFGSSSSGSSLFGSSSSSGSSSSTGSGSSSGSSSTGTTDNSSPQM